MGNNYEVLRRSSFDLGIQIQFERLKKEHDFESMLNDYFYAYAMKAVLEDFETNNKLVLIQITDQVVIFRKKST